MSAPLFTESMAVPPSDAEMERITRYTGGFMTPAEALAFETQLTEDPAFFYRIMPMLKVWYARKPTAEEIQIVRAAAERPPLTLHRGTSRQHAEHALGSFFELKTLVRTLAVAAAVGFIYLEVPHDRAKQQQIVPSKTTTQAPPKTPDLKTPSQVASTPAVQQPRPRTLAVRPDVSAPADSTALVGPVTVDRGDSVAVAAATAAPLPGYAVTEPAAVVAEGPQALPITITTPPIDSTASLLERIKQGAAEKMPAKEGWHWHWPGFLNPRNWFGPKAPTHQLPPAN